MSRETTMATVEEPNRPKSRRGNPQNLIVRHGAEAQELGRKGGLASGAARRAKCSFSDALRQALTVPIPLTSDRHGDWEKLIERFGMCDLTAQNLIVCRMIQAAIGGDVRAAAFIRDTLMMTSGGIEDAGNTERIAPVTADGINRLTVYHTLEVAAIRDKIGSTIRDAEETDRMTYGHTADVKKKIATITADEYRARGLVTLNRDGNGVTADLKSIEREEKEMADDDD